MIYKKRPQSITRLSGTIRVIEEQETIRIQLQTRKIRKGNPVALSDQTIIAAGTYFGQAEFDIASASDIKPYDCTPIRKLKTEEVCMIGDLRTANGQSRIEGHEIYVEPQDEDQFNQLIAATGKFTVLEGHLANFTFENGDEECGLLVLAINPLPLK